MSRPISSDNLAVDESARVNAYCQRLGIPLPDLDLLADDPKGTALFHGLVATLLILGRPAGFDEIAARMEEAGFFAETGAMIHSLRKAWHGLPPVQKVADGLLDLDLDSVFLGPILRKIGLRERPAPYRPPMAPVPPPSERLSPEEVETALARTFAMLSTVRMSAAVLDAFGDPQPLLAVETKIRELTGRAHPVTNRELGRDRRDLVRLDATGVLTLNLGAPDLQMMRKQIRLVAKPILQERFRRSLDDSHNADFKVRQAVMRRAETAEAATLRRAIVQVGPSIDHPRGVSVLALATSTIETYLNADRTAIEARLSEFNLLIGLDIRRALQSLGLDAGRWKLVDLNPRRKTRRLNKSGRTLKITPALLISGTTGISRPLGDKKRLAEYLRSGQTVRFRRRLESDVKALAAFYRFAVLHEYVRLRWGFLDESIYFPIGHRGDATLQDILDEAKGANVLVEIVSRSAPGWENPWARGVLCQIAPGPYGLNVPIGVDDSLPVPLDEIQAIRLRSDRPA